MVKTSGKLLCFLIATVFAVVIAEEELVTDKFSKASCEFTLDILKHVAAKYKTSNIIFSPASISIVLSVLQQGAKDKTLEQLDKVLHLTSEESKNGFQKLSELKEEKNITLEWGNRCYVKKNLKLNEEFKTTVKKYFDVGMEELDFGVSTPEGLAESINKWVEETTHKRITNLVEPSMLRPDTIMLLINAIFFKGNWQRPFKKSKTVVDKFEKSSESSTETLFMSQRGKFYSDRDGFMGAKWVQLPFQNNRFAMIFVLPTKKHRLSQLIEKLTGDDLFQIINHRGVSQVKMRIPKFKLSEKVSLVDTLQGLGLTDIFSGDSKLTGMTPENAQVSEIIHEANIEIDEQGSSASAATVVQLFRSGTPNLSFVADQPFLIFVVDVETGIPLFAGKVYDPKSEA